MACSPRMGAPRTRVGGQAILFSMKRLMDNMDAFEGFASSIGGVLPSGFRDEVNSWWGQGPHESLNV